MKLYLDDNRADTSLKGMLSKKGHTVTVPQEVGLAGASDACHLEHAIRHDFVVLTADRHDFWELHQLIQTSAGHYPGILVVRFQNDPTRDMKPRHIVAALDKLVSAGLTCADQVIILNQWR